MPRHEPLAQEFEMNRSHLQSVAHRMLGSASEADDAVQEAWLRLSRSDTSDIDNLRAWLTTVVARVCLDMLRSRKSRREEPLDTGFPEPIASGEAVINPEHEAVPADWVAFVLHDMFDLPFDEIAPIVGRSRQPPASSRAAHAVACKGPMPFTT